MNLLFRAAAVAALLLPLAVAPAKAQDYRNAFGVYGGWIWFSDLNRRADPVFVPFDTNLNNEGEFVSPRSLTLNDGLVVGAQAETWLGTGRFGLRLNGGYASRPWLGPRALPVGELDPRLAPRETFGAVNTWLGDGNVMIRILNPQPERVFAPYLALGLGVVHYDPRGALSSDIVFPAANAEFQGSNQTQFAGVFGIGTDILPRTTIAGTRLGFRIEAMDHLAFDSPLEPIEGRDFAEVHNVRVTAGLHLLGGRLFPPPVAIVPPPPPAPPPPPPPPPPPVEEALLVCTIDPMAPGGIRLVEAVFRPAVGDTLAVINAERVPFRTAYPATPPTYVRTADWFVSGQPLTMVVGDRRHEFVTFGATRIIEPEELTFLGTLHGVPLFASRAEVISIASMLAHAHMAQRDLPTLMRTHPEVRTAVEGLSVVYAPYDIGCVFVPLQRIEEVLKVRG